MVGIVGGVVVLGVTAVTIGRRPFVAATDVTRCAIERGVHSRQSDAGKLRMIELRSQPCIHRGMAVLACRGETRRLVIGYCILILNLVAGVAVHRQPLELSDRRVLVTGVAFHRGVPANQGESIIVALDL